jgi:hypothetical protein
MSGRNSYAEDLAVDAVVGLAPEVHEFYRVEKPELTPHVRLTFATARLRD